MCLIMPNYSYITSNYAPSYIFTMRLIGVTSIDQQDFWSIIQVKIKNNLLIFVHHFVQSEIHVHILYLRWSNTVSAVSSVV